MSRNLYKMSGRLGRTIHIMSTTIMQKAVIFALLVCFTYAAFSPMPASFNKARKTKVCTDYCLSDTRSNSGNFNFQEKGWLLCFCQAGTTSQEWQNGGCYKMCVDRCVATRGKCANQADKVNFKGPCCTTANKKNQIMKQCFNGTATGGAPPNGDCYQQV